MKKKQVMAMLTAGLVLTGSITGCGKNMAAAEAAHPAAANTMTEAASEAAYDESAAVYEEEYEEPAAEYYKSYDEGSYDTYEAAENSGYETAMAESGAELYADPAYYTGFSGEGYRGTASMKNGEGTSEGSYYDDIYDMGSGDELYDGDHNSYLGEIYDYSYVPKDVNTEEYAELEEQGYRSVFRAPLSTFGADVDTASYSNLRRMLNEGYSVYDLPKNSVRIEELINYFHYNYRGPKGSEPFGVNTMISDCPWNMHSKLLSIGLKTEDIDFADTPASNLVFLIDVSGSMNDYDKLPLLQEAYGMLADELSDKDRVSIVTYASGVKTVLEGEKGSNSGKIKRVLNNLTASGGTNGGAGIETAYRLAEKYFIKGGNNRVILATDGDLNLGVTSVGGLEELISMKKESGVYLSVLGFGTGNIKDNRMETLADKGNGNYAYIDSVREARKVLIDELSSNMLTVCKDVKFQVEFNPAYVKGYRLLGYADRTMAARDFDNDKKDGGEIGAGHEVTALYELIPRGRELDRNSELLTLSIRYKKPSERRSSLLTYPVNWSSYTDRPSDDFIFQSAVAEFGLIASNSAFMGSADLGNVVHRLESIRLNDEFKKEFKDMAEYARLY